MSKVLVVDDDDAIRRLIRLVLTRQQLAVREATNGAEAIHALEEEFFDAVVLDLMMPVVSGFEVIEHLRRLEGGHPAVVVISAAAETRIQQLDTAFIRAIIRKPFDINHLAETIRACLRREDPPPNEWLEPCCEAE